METFDNKVMFVINALCFSLPRFIFYHQELALLHNASVSICVCIYIIYRFILIYIHFNYFFVHYNTNELYFAILFKKVWGW